MYGFAPGLEGPDMIDNMHTYTYVPYYPLVSHNIE